MEYSASDSDNFEIVEPRNFHPIEEVVAEVLTLQPGQALRTKAKQHEPAKDLRDYSELIQSMIVGLTNLTKTNSSEFYKDQQKQVMSLLKQAYFKGENNSMLLLARSKQTMHSFINAVTDDIRLELDAVPGSKVELKVIRVNSILLNSETKILIKLGESLKLKQHQQAMAAKAQFHQLEMVDSIKRYFEENPGMAVLFVLEDIDYYVETTK